MCIILCMGSSGVHYSLYGEWCASLHGEWWCASLSFYMGSGGVHSLHGESGGVHSLHGESGGVHHSAWGVVVCIILFPVWGEWWWQHSLQC